MIEGSNPFDDSYAACPGGEEAVLKTVGLKGLVGSNPMRSVIGKGTIIK